MIAASLMPKQKLPERDRQSVSVIVHTCVVGSQFGSLDGMSNAIVSTVGNASPATHSPIVAPEGMFMLAAITASRSVQAPSSATTSPVLLTVIVLASAPVVMRTNHTDVARERGKNRRNHRRWNRCGTVGAWAFISVRRLARTTRRRQRN